MQDFRIEPKDEGDKAYAEGREARESGALLSDNPYYSGSENEDQWTTGWEDRDTELEEEEG